MSKVLRHRPKAKPITAEEARRITTRNSARLARRQSAERRKQNVQTAQDIRNALRTRVPKEIEAISAKIRKSNDGYVQHTLDTLAPGGPAVVEAIIHYFEELHYQVSLATDEGDENMGDFNAPYHVHYSRATLTISWKRP